MTNISICITVGVSVSIIRLHIRISSSTCIVSINNCIDIRISMSIMSTLAYYDCYYLSGNTYTCSYHCYG